MTLQAINRNPAENLPAIIGQSDTVPAWFRTELIHTGTDVLKRFYAHKSPGTLKAYSEALQNFANYIQSPSVPAMVDFIMCMESGPLHGLVDSYKEFLMSRGLSASYTNIKISALKSMLKSGRMIGVTSVHLDIQSVPVDPYGKVSGPKPEQVQTVLKALCDLKSKKGYRDTVAILLMVTMGLRRAECVSLDVSDIDIHGCKLQVRRKGRHSKEELTMPVAVRDAIRKWKVYRDGSTDALLTSFDTSGKSEPRLTGAGLNGIIKKAFRLIGISVTCHQLRHTAITVAASRHNNLFKVSKFAGHRSINTTAIYVDRLQDAAGEIAADVAEFITGSIQ